MSASKNIHNTKCILRITLTGILTVSCVLFNGCSPEAFAVGALAFRYWEVQVQKEREEKIRLARQQESIPIARQPEIVHAYIQQPDDRSTVQKANQAYRNLKWDESASLLKGAINRGELSRSDQCEAYILLGAIAYQQGQVNEAESYFTRALELDNKTVPSAELYPPQLIAFFKSVAKRK